MIVSSYIELSTRGQNEIIDISGHVKQLVQEAGIENGSVLIFVPGSTGALSTVEFEPGLVKDIPEFLEKIIPESNYYHHNETWHDGNGHSHIRATLMGPSLTVPIVDAQLTLGTWQQIIFLEFDNKPHQRRLIVQIAGE